MTPADRAHLSPGRTRPVVRTGLAGLLAGSALWVAVMAAAPVPVAAHSELESTDPAAGARLDDRPDRVTLTFGEDLEPRFTALTLTAGDADPVDLDVDVNGDTVAAALPADTPVGRWKVAYRVVSTDGHPVTGSLIFTVADDPASSSPAQTPTRAPRPTPAPVGTPPAPSTTTVPAATASTSPPPSNSASPSSAAGSTADPHQSAAEAAGSAWWKWPLVAVVAVTLMAAPAAAAVRGLGSAPGPDGTGGADDD